MRVGDHVGVTMHAWGSETVSPAVFHADLMAAAVILLHWLMHFRRSRSSNSWGHSPIQDSVKLDWGKEHLSGVLYSDHQNQAHTAVLSVTGSWSFQLTWSLLCAYHSHIPVTGSWSFQLTWSLLCSCHSHPPVLSVTGSLTRR
jgi:hypothetical protein